MPSDYELFAPRRAAIYARPHCSVAAGTAAVALVLATSATILATPLQARSRSHFPAPQARISVQVDIVNVPVTVTNNHGDFVSGLSRENFRVFVDGTEQPVKYFTAAEEPARALLLVETGPAVYLLRHEHVFAARELLSGLSADDRVAIASYSETMQPILDFTANKQQAEAALTQLNFGSGMAGLNFYDCLGAALDWSASSAGKQTIVALTTGLDSSGAGHWEQLLEKLRQSNVMVLSVALGGELHDTGKHQRKVDANRAGDPGSEISFAASEQALESIAAETGGYAFFPRTDRDFEAAYRRIATLVRHEYSIGFEPALRDGRFHAIQVEVVNGADKTFNGKAGRPAYRVSTRKGFLAPAS